MRVVYGSLLLAGTCGSVVVSGFILSKNLGRTVSLQAAPKRLPENVEGVVYVNEKCINCAACSGFAPQVFQRNEKDSKHIVYHQPTTEEEIVDARAALVGCPVAAIRVETLPQKRHRATTPEAKEKVEELWTDDDDSLVRQMTMSSKMNDLAYPFPRLVNQQNANSNIYYIGHHNEHSFGAVPYLLHLPSSDKWVMMDTPKYGKNAIEAVDKLTGGKGPDYLVLSHVDDTADHNLWNEHYDNMKRVFHSGDLGRHNWLGDKTLEKVEILLEPQEDSSSSQLQAFTLDGTPIELSDEFWNNKSFQRDPTKNPHEAIIFHTPGHSPGSITLWTRPSEDDVGALLTGDTYAYTTRNGGMATGFPRYGNNLKLQSETLEKLLQLDWDLVCPGHGHIIDYSALPNGDTRDSTKQEQMNQAINGLLQYA